MKNSCIEVSIYGEKNYRLFLDVIKHELDKSHYTDITAIQALILLNIGNNIITIGEVISRGYYIGSNASYNVKKLTNTEYIEAIQSEYDKRAMNLKLTKKGLSLCEKLEKSIQNHFDMAEKDKKIKLDMQSGLEFLKCLERFWNDILHNRI